MNKRWTLISVVVLAVMMAGIAFGVSRLYRTEGEGHVARVSLTGVGALLRAVPSDAALLLSLDGSRASERVLADSTGLLAAVFAPENPRLMDYLRCCGGRRIVVSLHNSGALLPLVVTECKRADSAHVAPLLQAAVQAGLQTRLADGLLLASRSETLLGTAIRHLDSGLSILSSDGLPEALSLADGPACLLVGSQQTAKLLQVYGSARFRLQADFIRSLARWTVLTLSADQTHVCLSGHAVTDGTMTSFLEAFRGERVPVPAFPDVLPYATEYAYALPMADATAFLERYHEYVDAKGRSFRYDKAVDQRGGRDLSPREWARHYAVKEVVKARLTLEGASHDLLLVRAGKGLDGMQASANPYPDYVQHLFGPAFSAVDTLRCAVAGRWLVLGDAAVIRAYSGQDLLSYTLKERLSDAGLSFGPGFAAYGSFTDDPSLYGSIFSAALGDAVRSVVGGTAFAPALVSADPSGDCAAVRIALEKRMLKGNKVQVLDRDTTVVVPAGDFPVINSATGQTNYLYQNAHLSLCLKDENGKGVWGVPFSQPLCGNVESIDYYGNGKIQFLVAAGDQLYLLDRLGRFVNGFPVALPKPVLLGPQAYDFTGAHGYTVMVLHRDNTLEMYNLHGVQPEGWAGIHAPETVKFLPELLEVNGQRYWVVRTSIRTLIYPFHGGAPLTGGEGGKMIRPDARLTVKPRGVVSAECYDGRIRDLKL